MGRPVGAAMKHQTAAIAAALAIASFPLTLLANEAPPGSAVTVGERIRLSSSAIPKRAVGQVVEIDSDSLKIRLQDHADPVEVPLASVTRWERSLGKRGNPRKGALIGGLIGAGAGAIFGGILQNAEEGSVGAWAVSSAVVVGGLGALVGAGVGGLHKSERWQDIPLGRAQARLILMPQPRGAGFALAVRF